MSNKHILAIIGSILLIIACNSNPDNKTQLKTADQKSMNAPLKMLAKIDGKGPPILLVPGGLTGWKSWESFVEYFTGKQKKVIRVELLSVQYGYENRPLPSGYTVKTESHALAATLDSLGLSRPMDIVAWSFGAFTSLDFALDHPDRVRTLTLIEPPAVWSLRETGPLDPETTKTVNFFETLQGDITEDMLAAFLQEAGFLQTGQSARELPQWQQWVPFRQSLRNCTAVASHRDKLDRLHHIHAPVLLVKGTGSAPFLHRIIDVLAAQLPNARVIEFPGGHAPHIVSRDRFLAELGNFQRIP
jgi:pimeloyl-ACP methyl ester carboxylesterase